MHCDPEYVRAETARRWRDRDLDSPSEIAEMVRRFYVDVAQDDLLGPMFNEVARVDWSTHLPKLSDFWCRALLSLPGYDGNPYRAHLEVHAKREFTPAQFQRWLDLFEETLDLGWRGPNVERARAFARRIATVHGRQLTGADVDWTDTDHVPATEARATSDPIESGARQ